MSRHEAGRDSSKCHQNFDVINVFLQSVWVLSNWHLLSKSCSVRRVLTNWYLQEKMAFPVRGFILLTSIAWRPWRHTTMEKTEITVLHFHFSRKSKACSDFLPEKKGILYCLIYPAQIILLSRWRERKCSFYLFSLPVFCNLHSVPEGWFPFCALFTVFIFIIKNLNMVTGKWGIPCTGILCYLQSRSQSLQLRPLEFNKKKSIYHWRKSVW